MSRRFAEDTRVPVAKSQHDLKALLRKAGAGQLATFEGTDGSAVMFELSGGMFRPDARRREGARDPEQDERRSWRMLILLTKAKLEAIAEGVTTVDREFMAHRLLYDGRTVDETIGEDLRIAHREGRMPKQLLIGGPAG